MNRVDSTRDYRLESHVVLHPVLASLATKARMFDASEPANVNRLPNTLAQ
jgi:hypothetical protein